MANEKRLIDANALMNKVAWYVDEPDYQHIGEDWRNGAWAIGYEISIAPTVDAVEVVHGEWRYYSTTMQECSNCYRHTARHRFKYCPHCGAIMEDKYND